MTAPTERGAPPGFVPPGDPALDLSRSSFPSRLARPGTLTVLDITKYFGEATGGIRTYLLAKAAYVQARADLRQLLVIPGPHDGLGHAGHVRCYRLKGPRIPFDQSYRFLLASRTTRRIVEHERPDLIEVGSPWLVPWITRRANRGLQAPLVWFYHTHFPRIIDPLGAGGTRRALGRSAWAYVRRLARIYRGILAASESVARKSVASAIASLASRTVVGTVIGVPLLVVGPETAPGPAQHAVARSTAASAALIPTSWWRRRP